MLILRPTLFVVYQVEKGVAARVKAGAMGLCCAVLHTLSCPCVPAFACRGRVLHRRSASGEGQKEGAVGTCAQPVSQYRALNPFHFS